MLKISKKVATMIVFGLLVCDTLFIVLRLGFFTNDKLKKDTIEKSAVINMNEEKVKENAEKLLETNLEELVRQKKENEASSLQKRKQELEKIASKSSIREESNTTKEVTVRKTTTKAKTSSSTTTKKKNTNTKKATTSTKKTSTSAKKTTTKKKTTTSTSKVSSSYKGYETIGRIEIPKTGVNIPILKKVYASGMEFASCLLYTNGALNKSGNSVIIGHNYNNGKLFSNNKKLKVGDKIYITTLDGTKVTYTIYKKFTTTDDDASFFKRKTDTPEISISTCSDDETHRIVILARKQ